MGRPAAKELAAKTRSSLGPDGLNKMVINHLGKLFVTHDAATILRELEVEHPNGGPREPFSNSRGFSCLAMIEIIRLTPSL